MSSTLKIVAVATFMLFGGWSCSAKTAAPSSGEVPQATSMPEPMGTPTCSPVPLPTPQVILVYPAPDATNVPRKIARVRFEIMSGGTTASRIVLKPASGGSFATRAVAPRGTPGPGGQQNYEAAVSGLLAFRMTYHVEVSGVQTFGGCGSKYSSPSGSFKTGSKRN